MKYTDLVNVVHKIIAGYSIPLTLRQVYYPISDCWTDSLDLAILTSLESP